MDVRVVCLGDVMTDVVALLSGPLAPGSDAPAPITHRPGGAAANTAAWLAAEGVPTTLVAKVGTDAAGQTALGELSATGVDLCVARTPDRATGTCIVLVAPDGERTMVPDAGANATLAPADVPDVLFGPGTHLHLSGYALLDPGSREAARHALRLGQESGATSSVDPASAAPLRALGPELFLDWVSGVGTVLANEDEAQVLTGERDPLDAVRALGQVFGEAVVKLGPGGALWSGAGRPDPLHVAAEPARVVDTTGAGDAFAAGWLAARLAGDTAEGALRAGCSVAGRVVAQVGTRPPHVLDATAAG